jgi:hypothetical protein
MERIYPSEQADEAKARAERVLEIVREIRKQLE